MARRSFDVIDIVEVLQHWHAGRPKSVVASSLGIDVKTVRKYVAKAKAEAEGMVPGSAPLSRAEWEGRVRDWFPELVDARARSLTFAQIDKHRERIERMLATNTVTTVHQRLRHEHGLAVGITSFRRYVAAEFADATAREQATPPRPPVAPGEEAQVDYGLLGSWQDPAGGRVRRVWAFIMVLAFSRHMFVRPVLTMDRRRGWPRMWPRSASSNGAVRRIVTDNLAAGDLVLAQRLEELV
jgi:transposase